MARHRTHSSSLRRVTTGAPHIPGDWVGDNCCHACGLQDLSRIQPHQSVLVVGGGQSGVEICEEIIEDRPDIRLSWCTGRRVRLITRHSPSPCWGRACDIPRKVNRLADS
ncbi:SidA/IucD/PvdA family monooxygenase [Streptomyces sp. L7]